MRHFKFVGGPWDGEYHEMDSECVKRGYLDVANPPPFVPVLAMEEVTIDERTFEHTTYTIRYLTGPHDNGSGNVYYFADSEWSDIYAFSQLVHHYRGRP